MYRILIVEDDAVIAKAIAERLARWGYDAIIAADFSAIDAEFQARMPHLVLMDVSLPYYNGYYWCERIRRVSKTPIVFLSSRTDTSDVVMAIGMGADDYIIKPVDPELLIAKVQAVLRRSYDYEQTALPRLGEYAFDAAKACLVGADKSISLTKNESRLLLLLIYRRGEIVSREELMLGLWNSDEFVDENTLTVNMNRLRKTLDQAGLSESITTHKGRGYAFHA